MTKRIALVVAGCVVAAGCSSTADTPARKQYNQGIEAFQAGKWEEAQTTLLKARDLAGLDAELRYRAAYNLGLAFAAQAEALATSEPKKAIELLDSAAGWFEDAIRLRESDKDARTNHEIVLRRRMLLSDTVNKADDVLTATLERVIEDQRGLLGGIREILAELKQQGAQTGAFRDRFRELESTERSLLSDVSSVVDLAAGELKLLEDRATETLKDEEKLRMAQLKNLEVYLEGARTSQAAARRSLRKQQAHIAHSSANLALDHLKRAREQLLDPIQVIGRVAKDQELVAKHTAALEAFRGKLATLSDDNKPEAPVWLTSAHLAEREQDVEQRTSELHARFSAAGDAAADGDAPDANSQPQDPKQARMMAAVRESVPFLLAAKSAMQAARDGLTADATLTKVLAHQRDALIALSQALERFSGLKEVIEQAYRQQQTVVTLMTPPPKDAPKEAHELSSQDRQRLITEGTNTNRDRVDRLKELIAEEAAQAQAQAAQAQQGNDPNSPGNANADEANKQVEATKQRYDKAEQERTQAAAALVQLALALSTKRRNAAPPPITHAQKALTHITELRKLFFSLVEHLKQLARDQGETRDKTATAQTQEDDKRTTVLGPLTDYQSEHSQRAEAIAGALDQQADAIAQSGEEGAEDKANTLGQAATEVRSAAQEMTYSADGLREASTGAVSYDLAPLLENQQKALQHLAEAIRLLEPPKNQNQNQQQQDKNKQQQQQQDKMSKQEVERRMQAIREREAKRRKQQKQQQPPREMVDKDW